MCHTYMKKTISIIIGLALVLGIGCAKQEKSDASPVCEVHHVPMRLVVTSSAIGWSGSDTNYMAAASRLFPHVPSEATSTNWAQKQVWVCDECIKARSEWEQSHK
jgi:hypothetical protein